MKINHPLGNLTLIFAGLLASLTATQAAVVNFTGYYAPANWSTTLPTGSSKTHSATTLTLVGPDGVSSQSATVSITVPTASIIHFNYSASTVDEEFSYDPAGYSINGTLTQLTPGSATTTSGSRDVTVAAGQTFAFYVRTTDGMFGSTTMTVTGFTVVPETETMGVLAGVGLLGLAAFRRFQTRR